jgi:hypothetical protein
MAKVKARVTMFAEPIEVDESELPSLRGQGLLIEDEPAAKPAAPAPAAPNTADKTEEKTP